MAQQVCVVLSVAECEQLAAIAADRNRPRKHVEPARIVLASADRHSAQRVAQSIGDSRPTVWRWQQRFAESGVEGLLHLRAATNAYLEHRCQSQTVCLDQIRRSHPGPARLPPGTSV